jgi:hypothetical protein
MRKHLVFNSIIAYFVNLFSPLHLPQFFSLPKTGVNPFRGFIRPAFRANGIKAREDLETRFLLKSHAVKL